MRCVIQGQTSPRRGAASARDESCRSGCTATGRLGASPSQARSHLTTCYRGSVPVRRCDRASGLAGQPVPRTQRGVGLAGRVIPDANGDRVADGMVDVTVETVSVYLHDDGLMASRVASAEFDDVCAGWSIMEPERHGGGGDGSRSSVLTKIEEPDYLD